jgi:hypothetical protein
MPTTWLGLNQISFKLITTTHTYQGETIKWKGKVCGQDLSFLVWTDKLNRVVVEDSWKNPSKDQSSAICAVLGCYTHPCA